MNRKKKITRFTELLLLEIKDENNIYQRRNDLLFKVKSKMVKFILNTVQRKKDSRSTHKVSSNIYSLRVRNKSYF